jgi:lipopolysaccharide assembly protein A
MRYLRWILRILLFAILLGFTIKNTDPVVVRYFLGWQWHAPLALVLLVFFVSGAVLGVLAGFTWLYDQRRELLQLRREQSARQGAPEPGHAPPERRSL